MFAGKHVASPAEAVGNFVHDQQDIVLIAELA